MKTFHLVLILVLTISNNVLSQKIDSTKIADEKTDLSVNRHGIYAELGGGAYTYSFGYMKETQPCDNLPPQKSQTNDSIRNKSKNYIGLKSSGLLFVGNVSVFYGRNLYIKNHYAFNLEMNLLYGYKLFRHTNNLGLGFSLNNYFGKNKHHFLLGIGGDYLFSPMVFKHPEKEIYSTAGAYESKQTINLYLRLGWRYTFSKYWTILLAYDPGISLIDIWDFPKYPLSSNYRFQPYFAYANIEFSFLYFF